MNSCRQQRGVGEEGRERGGGGGREEETGRERGREREGEREGGRGRERERERQRSWKQERGGKLKTISNQAINGNKPQACTGGHLSSAFYYMRHTRVP